MNDFGAFGNNFSATALPMRLKRKIESDYLNPMQDCELEIPANEREKRQRTNESLTSFEDDHQFPKTRVAFDPNHNDCRKQVDFGFTVSNANAAQNMSCCSVNLPKERFESGQFYDQSIAMESDTNVNVSERMLEDEDSENSSLPHTDNHINSVRNSTCEVVIEDRRSLNGPGYCRSEGMWDTMIDIYMYHGL